MGHLSRLLYDEPWNPSSSQFPASVNFLKKYEQTFLGILTKSFTISSFDWGFFLRYNLYYCFLKGIVAAIEINRYK